MLVNYLEKIASKNSVKYNVFKLNQKNCNITFDFIGLPNLFVLFDKNHISYYQNNNLCTEVKKMLSPSNVIDDFPIDSTVEELRNIESVITTEKPLDIFLIFSRMSDKR